MFARTESPSRGSYDDIGIGAPKLTTPQNRNSPNPHHSSFTRTLSHDQAACLPCAGAHAHLHMPCLPCAGAHAHLHMPCLPHLHMPAHLQTQGWGRNVTKVRSTRCCCKHTHVCCRILKLRLSPKGQRLHRFGRPPAAVGTHMCVAEYFNAELHRGSRFTRFGRPMLLGAYTCVLQNR